MIREQVMSFAPWTRWADRNLVKNAHLPGVYLLAHWDAAPPSRVDPLSQEIVYIGETTDQSLMGRWQQFHRAAFEGKPGHSGGMLYHEAFGDDEDKATLYVSAFVPEGLSREMRALYIRYASHKLIWDWARCWGG